MAAKAEDDGLSFVERKGGISIEGPRIAQAVHNLTGHDCHETEVDLSFLSEAEYRQLGPLANPDIDLTHLYFLGEGSSHVGHAKWIVVIWNHGNAWRRRHGLPPKQFHVMLSKEDDLVSDKGISSLEGGDDAATNAFLGLDENGMDHMLAADPTHIDWAARMVVSHPDSYKGYIRLGDAAAKCEAKIALLAYAQALRINESLLPYVTKRTVQLSGVVAWGPQVTHEELTAISAYPGMANLLLQPWTVLMTQMHKPQLWRTGAAIRERASFAGHRLPRFFSWLYPGRLAGMSTPLCESDIDALVYVGITTVLTLTMEEPLPSAWFAWKPIKNIYIPVKNLAAPSLAEMDLIYNRFADDKDGAWLVHCGGGKGRAGTVLACLIAMLGYTKDDIGLSGRPRLDKGTAIREIRELRPGSLESERQERFIGEWINHRWSLDLDLKDVDLRVQNSLQVDICDRDSFPTGISHTNVQTITLIGLPGSGKSWLAEAILKRRSQPTIIINQDENRSRNACETAFSRSYPPGTLVILDRCNTSVTERTYFNSLSLSTLQHVAVHFDYRPATCTQRINTRLNHPTVTAGHGTNAMKQMSAHFSAPTADEGCSAILTITSFAAAREAVHLLGGPVGIVKFPRTAHLIDLGATTADDIVQEMQEISGNLVVEEKVDGANMGISLDWDGKLVVQNRSHWVSTADHPQFKGLDKWLEEKAEGLRKILHRDEQYPERFVLYGEWVVAKHSIHYTALPDRFLAFDLYDRLDKKFISRRLLDWALKGSDLSQVPIMWKGDRLRSEELLKMVERKSAYYDGPVEGAYVRFEDQDRRITKDRGKVVRGDFLSGNEHWTKGPLVPNGIVEHHLA